MCQSQEATGSVSFQDQHEHIRRGDIIGIIGVGTVRDLIGPVTDVHSFLAGRVPSELNLGLAVDRQYRSILTELGTVRRAN